MLFFRVYPAGHLVKVLRVHVRRQGVDLHHRLADRRAGWLAATSGRDVYACACACARVRAGVRTRVRRALWVVGKG